MFEVNRTDIRSLTLEELQAQFQAWKQPSYRVVQVFDWLYRRRTTSWDAMSNLPKELRRQLSEEYLLEPIELVRKQGSQDTTQKYLWRLRDGALIESVLIPANPAFFGDPSDRHTLCVSTQVGCAYGCKFCASGLDGWKRNLLAHEIVDQVLAIERAAPVQGAGRDRLIQNIVVMGMGEPLANYANLMRALRILNASWGGGIGARKITVSTSGLVPQIRKLADEPVQFRLAVSLHGATDEVRNQIMPVNRKFPLHDLADACAYYVAQKGKMITLEYILMAGVNDGLDQTQPLADLAKRLHAKVNLIPYNHVEGLSWNRPSEAAQDQFLAGLLKHKVSATLRREKGHDIDAACGQLRLKTEREFQAKMVEPAAVEPKMS